LAEADVPLDNEVPIDRTGNLMSVKKRKPTSSNNPTDAQQERSVGMEPAKRLWLKIIDTVLDGAGQPVDTEPELFWVEIISSDEDSIVVRRLISPTALPAAPRVLPRVKIGSGTPVSAFLNIKLKAEYARDTIGGAKASTSRPDEIPPTARY
jgi:hypothetical protein